MKSPRNEGDEPGKNDGKESKAQKSQDREDLSTNLSGLLEAK